MKNFGIALHVTMGLFNIRVALKPDAPLWGVVFMLILTVAQFKVALDFIKE